MSTHIEFAHMRSNNFHPFNLNYVYFYIPPPLDPPNKIGGVNNFLLTLSPHQNFFVGGGYIFQVLKINH